MSGLPHSFFKFLYLCKNLNLNFINQYTKYFPCIVGILSYYDIETQRTILHDSIGTSYFFPNIPFSKTFTVCEKLIILYCFHLCRKTDKFWDRVLLTLFSRHFVYLENVKNLNIPIKI